MHTSVPQHIKAPITANVWKVIKSEGEEVAENEAFVILESMKMEIPVESPVKGKITKLFVKEGSSVIEGDVMAIIE